MAVLENPLDGVKATVNQATRLNVSASSNPRDFYSSRDEGKLFNLVSGFDATTGAVIFSMENNSPTDDCYVGYARISCTTLCSFDFYFTESGDTPAGKNQANHRKSKPSGTQL